MMPARINKNGSILIFSLWILMILGIFAAQVGLRVAGRIQIISRVETRGRLHHIASASSKKAIALIRADLRKEGGQDSAYGKYYKYNKGDIFRDF